MTLGLAGLLSVCLVPLLLGVALLRAQGVVPRTDPLAYLGWAWIQGSLGVGLGTCAWAWTGWPLRASALVPVLVGASVLVLWFSRRVPAWSVPRPERSFGRTERLFFALALGLVLVASVDRILIAGGRLVATADEAVIWAARAKLLFHSGGFNEAYGAGLRARDFVQHPDYPPLNPLLQVWVHSHAGHIVHSESRLPVQLLALAGLLVGAAAVRRRLRPALAAVFVLCLGTLGAFEFSLSQLYSDVLIATGVLLSWDLWQRHQEDGERRWLRLLATGAPLLVWSKNEGMLEVMAFVGALALAALLRRGPRPRWRTVAPHLAWLLPLVLSIVYLQWSNRHFGMSNDLVDSWTSMDGGEEAPLGVRGEGISLERARERAPAIAASFTQRVAEDPDQTHHFLLAVLLLTLLDPRRAFARDRAVFTLGLWLALAGYMAVYLGTHWEIEQHLKHSSHRLVYHLVPAAGLWLALWLAEAGPAFSAAAHPADPARMDAAERA